MEVSTIEPPAADATVWTIDRVTGLLLDHVAPASYYVFGAMASAMALAALLRGDAGAATAAVSSREWLIVQQALTTAFLGLIVLFFVVRRERLGMRRGLLVAIATLIGHPADPGARAQVKSEIGPAVIALAGTNALYIVNLAPITQPDAQPTIVSSALLVVGLLLSIVSIASLGRCFGVFPEARGLATGGPYRWIRHPLYL